MGEPNNIKYMSIFRLISTPYATSQDDGQRVYDVIATAFKGGFRVALSFKYMETVTPTFLNAAIGQLYGEFDDDTIKQYLQITGLRDIGTLVRVIKNAKEYFIKDVYK